MVPKAKCGCGSAYTRSVGGELVCDVCAQMRHGMRQVQRAEKLREIAAQLGSDTHAAYIDALRCGALALERDAANVEYVAQRMRLHRVGAEREVRQR
jgi:hypothetical protein